jgi:hypothetical protein
MSTQDSLLSPRRALQVDTGERYRSRRSVCATQYARNSPLNDCSSIVAEASSAGVQLRKTRWRRADVEAT